MGEAPPLFVIGEKALATTRQRRSEVARAAWKSGVMVPMYRWEWLGTRNSSRGLK